MKEFESYLTGSIKSGKISEIIALTEGFYKKEAAFLSSEEKVNALCCAMRIERDTLDRVISSHPEVLRTVSGHAFEAVFDQMMTENGIECVEVGGDTDVDRIINGFTLQLKTPFVRGCSRKNVSYKTHKTHGAKSMTESVDYYHRADDFADFLVGLVSYEPFSVLIVPREALPRVEKHPEYIKSPMYLERGGRFLNNFEQLGIRKNLYFPKSIFLPGENECLPLSCSRLKFKSEFILSSIFDRDNFRIWDMNIRGFIREEVFLKYLSSHSVQAYPTSVTGLERADKCDLVLKNAHGEYVRFQVKGLTWSRCTLNGEKTVINCETQLSRGRTNDHPTQSRLYKATDFDFLIIAVDPPYANTLSLAAFGTSDCRWRFFCVPVSELRRHPSFEKRIFANQRIAYKELLKYLVTPEWFKKFKAACD